MNSEHFRLRGRRGGRRSRDIGDTTLRRVAEGVERGAVEAADRRRTTEARACAARRLARLRVVQAADELPAPLVAGEDQGLAVMARSHDGFFGSPSQRYQRKGGQLDGEYSRAAGVDDVDSTVVRNEREHIARRREADAMNPASSWARVFATDRVEGQLLAPDGRRRPS